MKIFLCSILLFGVCVSSDNEQGAYRTAFHDDDRSHDNHHDGIMQPCSLQDVSCIRQFFQHNLQCLSAYGRASEPVLIELLFDVPHVNMTFILNNARIKGLNDWKVEEFYINKKTDTLVFEVVFKSLKVYSTNTVVLYLRKGKEPIELADSSSIDYNDLSLTLIISNFGKLGHEGAHVFTHVSDVAPRYETGPNIMKSKDPYVQFVNNQLFNTLNTTLQEVFVKQGPVIMSVYLQTSICKLNIDTC